jgi:diguanylate cyclase (GGDEF)-like protein
MPTKAIMKHTAATARRTVLIALTGAAVMVGAVVVERASFERNQASAMLKLMAAEQAASSILLADERLTMSAKMLAATGDRRWLDRYEANIPLINDAIRRASALAPSSAAKRFDDETRVANDRLVALQRAAFAAVRRGDARSAHRLLGSGLYKHHKRVLAEGTDRFIASTLGTIQSRLRYLQRRTEIAIPLIILICGLGAYALWYRLNVSLQRLHTAFVRAENTIRRLAMNDALTGLANRRALYAQLQDAIASARRDKAKLALFMFDLDHFKPINDEHGHLVGDNVLKEVASRLTAVLPQAVLRSRYGGDEFVVAVRYEGDDDVARTTGHKIITALGPPMTIDGHKLQIGATLGSAIFPNDAATNEELIRKADLALRNAKRQARGAARAYDAVMDVGPETRAQLEAEVRAAVAAGAFVPYFQPIVHLGSGKIRGFEVLCRWQHPTRGLLQPCEFIPLVESLGLIDELTIALLETAFTQARTLPKPTALSINISPQQIQDAALVHNISAVLATTGFDPKRLHIELTENTLVSDLLAAKGVIAALKRLGIRTSLDDFGTGYSSLSYLAELPIDAIKIDRSFIRTLQHNEQSAKIVTAILGLGKSLSITTIAEGIETERQVAFLKAGGCELGQGHYFGKPMPVDDAKAVLQGRRAPSKRQLVA